MAIRVRQVCNRTSRGQWTELQCSSAEKTSLSSYCIHDASLPLICRGVAQIHPFVVTGNDDDEVGVILD